MGLFDKLKKSKRKIIDESNNKEVTEMLGNSALRLLDKDKDYKSLDGLKCIFGYCITGIDKKIEALYKIETDTCIAYFQAINDKVIRLNIDEKVYISAVEFFYNNNPQLKNN